MPSKGKSYNLSRNSRLKRDEVLEAIRIARNSSIQMMMVMLFGDPTWIGTKRACFRPGDMAAVPTAPQSMSLKIRPGSAALNDGVEHDGNWYLVFTDGTRQVTFDPAHATLDRYDILCAIPKRVATGSLNREFVDQSGNVETRSDVLSYLDDFDLYIEKGEPGAAAPEINRLNAYTAVEAGKIPISLVKIRAAATSILITDLVDLRELCSIRMYPIAQALPADVVTLLGALPPNQLGNVAIATNEDIIEALPDDMLFIRRIGNVGAGTLCLMRKDRTILEIG
ncbi:MAG TPA: hypothetical protein VK181_06410 [Rhizobium sp.]|nr:hypothetical protein [Rhizobium sp.]